MGFSIRLLLGGIGAAIAGVVLLVAGRAPEFELPFYPWNAILMILLGIVLAAVSAKSLFKK